MSLPKKRPHLLLFDATNIIHRTFSVQDAIRQKKTIGKKTVAAGLDNDEDAVDVELQMAGLAHHTALASLNKYYTRFNPDRAILAFDRPNWRKTYTKSDESLTHQIYKGNRRENQTPEEEAQFKKLIEHISEFEGFIRDHTGLTVLSSDGLEADDLIAGVVQMFHAVCDITIISADRDMMQLLRYESVCLINPSGGEPRTLSQYNMDADYFMFEKCIRGDRGDHVRSAFPGVRATRLQKAYSDPFEFTKLMNETWTDADKNVYVVKEIFEENQMLMDLSKQPAHVREQIQNVIQEAFDNPGQYNYFQFLRFCGKYGLQKVADSLHLYQRMLMQPTN